jgi:hypothetical protein
MSTGNGVGNMVLTSGFEPLPTDPQSVVLTTNTKLEWC